MVRLYAGLYVTVCCAGLVSAVEADQAAAPPPMQTAPAAQTPPAKQTAADTTAASTNGPTAQSTPSAAPAHVEKSQELTPEEKRLLSQGYRLETRHGEKMFCRREIVLGSHFEKKVCGTATDLANTRRSSRDTLDAAQRSEMNPNGK